MGYTYEGTYRHQIESYSHEGYPSDNGRDLYRAACECGWVGHGLYEQTPEGEDAVMLEWQDEHLRPLLRAEAEQQPDIPAVALLELTWALGDRAETAQDQPSHYHGVCEAKDAVDALLEQYAVTSFERSQAQARAAMEGREPTAWSKLALSARRGDDD